MSRRVTVNSCCALGLTTRLALRARFLLRRSRSALAFPARAARSRLAALALRARIFFIENFILKTIVVRKRFPKMAESRRRRRRRDGLKACGLLVLSARTRIRGHGRGWYVFYGLALRARSGVLCDSV